MAKNDVLLNNILRLTCAIQCMAHNLVNILGFIDPMYIHEESVRNLGTLVVIMRIDI